MSLSILSEKLNKPIINNQITIKCVNNRTFSITFENNQFIIKLDSNYLLYKNASNTLEKYYDLNGIKIITNIDDVIQEINGLQALSGWIERVFETPY